MNVSGDLRSILTEILPHSSMYGLKDKRTVQIEVIAEIAFIFAIFLTNII